MGFVWDRLEIANGDTTKEIWVFAARYLGVKRKGFFCPWSTASSPVFFRCELLGSESLMGIWCVFSFCMPLAIFGYSYFTISLYMSIYNICQYILIYVDIILFWYIYMFICWYMLIYINIVYVDVCWYMFLCVGIIYVYMCWYNICLYVLIQFMLIHVDIIYVDICWDDICLYVLI